MDKKYNMTVGLKSTTNELVSWFQTEYPFLVKAMKEAQHHYDEVTLNPYHLEGDVFTHTMMVCLMAKHVAPDNDVVRWSSLLHDIGKPGARKINDETMRVAFHGHEGLSSFMAIDILNKADIPVADKIMIYKLIAMHGELFHFVKSDGTIKSDILDAFKGERALLENLTYQVWADSFGRFWQNGRVTNIDAELPEHFKPIVEQLGYSVQPMKNTGNPKLTVLVGPPCSGKSTWMASNVVGDVVISRDALVEAAGAKRGLNYSESFKFLNANKDVSDTEVDGVLSSTMVEARNAGKDVVIDMTNMSKKGRRRWVTEFAKYDKKAVVFLTGFEELKKRNKIRAEKTGKYIPSHVLQDMCIRYSMPTYAEGFNDIQFLWNE